MTQVFLLEVLRTPHSFSLKLNFMMDIWLLFYQNSRPWRIFWKRCCSTLIGSLKSSGKCLVATMASFRNIKGCLSRGNGVLRGIREVIEALMLSAPFLEETSPWKGGVEGLPSRRIMTRLHSVDFKSAVFLLSRVLPTGK